MLKKILHKISLLISKCIPPGKVLVFCSFPDFTDNAYAVYHYVLQQQWQGHYKLVWIVLDPHNARPGNIPEEMRRAGTVVYAKKSLRGLWYYYRARHVFMTHGLYSPLLHARPRTVVNLWHCMPIKRMGLMDHRPVYMENTQLLLATGALFQKIMAATFGKKTADILITGLPRNDLLFGPCDFWNHRGIDPKAFRRIGIWLPTYRASNIGDIRTDGLYKEGCVGFLDPAMLLELDDFLADKQILLLVKAHPMDKMRHYHFPAYRNILIVKPDEVRSQFYPLLGSTDFLLTDYSSVWVDYDILGKPMGFVMDDVAEYGRSRGFTLDNIEQESPGPVIRNSEQLYAFLTEPERYAQNTGERFNRFKDNHATERLMKILGY